MTAIETIIRAQTPHWDSPMRDYLRFECIPWGIVKATAQLGVNLNDSRFPNIKPEDDTE